jgi:hypothetical protein
MQLPNELVMLVNLVVLYLIVNGLKALSELLGKDLSGWGTILAGAIAATVVFFANQLLALAPADAQPIINAIFQLIVILLGAIGVKRFEVKTLRG